MKGISITGSFCATLLRKPKLYPVVIKSLCTSMSLLLEVCPYVCSVVELQIINLPLCTLPY